METTYLKHHGRKGQKWGLRNGPPYPLKPGAESAAEKRASATYGKAVKKKVKYGGITEEEYARMTSYKNEKQLEQQVAAAVAYDKNFNGRSNTNADASSMTTADLTAYNNRRAQEEKYRSYQKQDREKALEERTKDLQAIKDIAKNAQDTHALINKQVNDYYDARHKRQKAAMDLSKMSDDDLRRVINRLDLERRYRDLTPAQISRGERAWKRILNTTGTALPLANYALDTAIKIKRLID